MDDDAEDLSPKGFRSKWRKQVYGSSVKDTAHAQTFDDDVVVSFTAQSVTDACSASLDIQQKMVPTVDSLSGHDLGFDFDSLSKAAESLYEPSIAQTCSEPAPAVDVGGRSSMDDDRAAISDQFIRGAKFSAITLPWETPLMSQIFGDAHPMMNLSMPINWGSRELPVTESVAVGPSEPVVPSEKTWQVTKFVRHKTDETYLQQRDKTMHNALSKWKFLILIDPACSDVGKQLMGVHEGQQDFVLSSVMGVKSPNTVLKRANALMQFYRWHAVNGAATFLPFDECDVWQYVVSHASASVSASRSQSLIQASRFSHYVMGFDNALACASSRRISGQAQIQLSLRSPSRQARPLTVEEVKLLHKIADGTMHSKVDRCIASNLLLALYGRCRVSDLNFIHEILHDVSEGTGFIEVTTRFHKAARTVQQKALLLPILMSCSGVTQFPWVHSWIANRKACGLPTSGSVQGALMPAPVVGDTVNWMQRPLSAGEVTNILKAFVRSDDPCLSSHSLKATTLSWAAKAEVPREQRRILGRHSSAVQCSDSFYSRDLSVGPVNSLQKVIAMIRDGTFCPDATRANYFPQAGVATSSTPAHVTMQPFTPAFLGKAQPSTPGIDAPGGGIAAVLGHGDRGDDVTVPTDVKTEASWSVLNSGHAQDVIELSSSSGEDSSESDTCSSTSGDDESIDLDEEEPVQELDTGKQNDDGTCTMVKNCKTKIVHEVETGFAADIVVPVSDLKGKMTRCGHVVTANYQTVQKLVDWTLKCRVCYKGRRGPSKA